MIAQVALAFALLVGSGLALRAFVKVASTPPGFDPENLATAWIVVPAVKYSSDEKTVAFYQEVLRGIAAEPGVVSATANSGMPMGGSTSSGSFAIEDRPRWPAGSRPKLVRDVVTPGYFRTMGIPLVRGRDFTDGDTAGGRRVMVISHAAAERFFPGEDPIGRRIDLGDGEDDKPIWREIVGIAGDVRRSGPAHAVAEEAYVPLAQAPSRRMMIAARTPRAEALLKELPRIVGSVDAEQAVSSARLMRSRVDATIGPQRFVAVLLGGFAAAALVLATLGIFGLVSYTTSQRTRELGIRVALGAPPGAVVAVVMRDGLRLLAAGVGFGLVGALLVGRALAGRVSGAAAFDPVVVGAIVVVLALAGTLASFLPALRAVRIPPAVALRYE